MIGKTLIAEVTETATTWVNLRRTSSAFSEIVCLEVDVLRNDLCYGDVLKVIQLDEISGDTRFSSDVFSSLGSYPL